MAKKASKISKEGYLYSKNNGDDIDLDDELIHDPKFAKILNEDRQIIVGKKFYVFTTNGLYFCHKKDQKVLKQYLKELGKSSKNSSLAARACENMMKTGKGEGLNLSGPTAKITKIDEESAFIRLVVVVEQAVEAETVEELPVHPSRPLC